MVPESSLRPPSPNKAGTTHSFGPIRSAAASTLAAVTPRRKFTPTSKTGGMPAPSTSPRKASTAASVKSTSSASSSRSTSAAHSTISDAHYATPKSSIVSLRKAAAAAVGHLPSSSNGEKRAAAASRQGASPIKTMAAPTSGPARKVTKTTSTQGGKTSSTDTPNEPVKAFLRIRPTPTDQVGDSKKEPYIEVVSDTEVLMNPPRDASAMRARVYSSAVPTKYAFSRVFRGDAKTPEETSQSAFFKSTALPLVDELLHGQSGLVFTYGVTNSGKSYTVQGGSGYGEAGILPRSMDTIFNSIEGLESTSDIRPVGLTGVEHAMSSPQLADAGVNPFSLPGLSKRLQASSPAPLTYEHDDTMVKVDRNYRYSIWISYIEVYNEKIFDLLDAAPQAPSNASGMTRSPSAFGNLHRTESVRGLANWSLAPSESNVGPIYLQRKPLSLKNDVESGGKYVAGLHEVRVSSPAEAHELLRRGQENRRVFATMANRTSSRSHGVFTVKVIREHAGEDDLSVACSTSRLSIVDLAGSERLSNTAASGDRLKEAGNINKSLMCLGQCLETLRKNQSRAAVHVPMLDKASDKATGSSLPRMLNRRPSLVPYRHSKLTELFQSFFMGEGRAVMIVNVNPYDTGFDENSHVMRFSAAAKEVHTVRSQGHATNLSRFVHPSLRNLFNGGSATPAAPPMPQANTSMSGYMSPLSTPKIPPPRLASRDPWAATLASPPQAQRGFALGPTSPPPIVFADTPRPIVKTKDTSVQAVPEVSENVAESNEITILEGSDDEGDDSEVDPFVEHLMQRHEELRHMLFESEMRCAAIEREVREEMAEEMSERLLEMERLYNERMLADAEQNEEFVNRKLDLLAQASAAQPQRDDVDYHDEDSMLSSFVDDSADDSRIVEGCLAADANGHADARTRHADASVDNGDDSHLSAVSGVEDSGVANETGNLSTQSAEEAAVSDDDSDVTADASAMTAASASDVSGVDGNATRESVADSDEESSESDNGSVEAEDEEDVEDSEDEDEEEDSDDEFDVTEESIESSFEEPVKARTSRARQSAAIRGRVSIATRRGATVARPSTATRKRAAAPAAAKKGTKASAGPLGESSFNNLSHSASDEFHSDSSIILVSKTPKSAKKAPQSELSQDEEADENLSEAAFETPSKKATPSPKKKRMLSPLKGGRRTNPLSRDAVAMEQSSDVSLMEAMQRRIVS